MLPGRRMLREVFMLGDDGDTDRFYVESFRVISGVGDLETLVDDAIGSDHKMVRELASGIVTGLVFPSVSEGVGDLGSSRPEARAYLMDHDLVDPLETPLSSLPVVASFDLIEDSHHRIFTPAIADQSLVDAKSAEAIASIFS